MTIRVVNQGEEHMLDRIVGVAYTMRLFTNDVESGLTDTQVNALTESSFTEASFTGYTAAPIATGSWVTTQGDPSEATNADEVFTCTGTGAPQTIRGYYITRDSDSKLVWYEYLKDGPFVVEFSGSTVTVPPILTLDDNQEAEVAAQGIIAQQVLTANGSGLTVSSDTDMLLNNVPVVAGRLYGIHLHTEVQLSAALGLWTLNLLINGAAYDRFERIENGPDASENVQKVYTIDAMVTWEAPTTQATDDFLVRATEHSGTATLTLPASANVRRTLTIYDLGVAP
jgi:hypothetical protein